MHPRGLIKGPNRSAEGVQDGPCEHAGHERVGADSNRGSGGQVCAGGLQGDPQEREVLRELARESGALDPAAQAYAKRLAVKEQIRLKCLQPLGMLFGFQRDYFDERFSDEFADRMEDVPEKHLIAPRLSVAGPTLQGTGYTVDEPELRAIGLIMRFSRARPSGAFKSRTGRGWVLSKSRTTHISRRRAYMTTRTLTPPSSRCEPTDCP